MKKQPEPRATFRDLASNGPAARLTSEFNAAELGRIVGATQQHIGRVLRGQSSPSLAMAAKIATAAGVTLDEFARVYFEGDDDMEVTLAAIRRKREKARLLAAS